MARGKIKYRDVVGGRHGKHNKKKQFPKKYSLHKSEKKRKIFKRKFTNDISVQLQVKKLKTKELPVTEIFSESEESEIDDVKKLLNTFDGNLNDRRLLAVDSSNSENESEETDDNSLVNEENLYNLDDVLSEEGSLSNENENQNHQDKAVNKSDINEPENVSRSECKTETEEEIEYETDPENENSEDDLESSQDPFVKHFHFELSCNILESLENNPISVNSYDEYWPILGKLNIQIPKCEKIKNTIKTEYIIPEKKRYAPPGELPHKLDVKCIKTEELFIKPQIVTNLTKADKSFISYREGIFSPLQAELFSIMNNYQNLYFPRRSFNNAEEIRYIYCLHAANHILKTRIKVIHHNTRLSKKDEVPEEFRDQGLARPKVLIIVPFKDAAYKIIQMLISIILPDDKGNVMNKKRFIDDYTGNELIFPKKNPKPEDYEQTFQGNTSDDFKIGITITKKSLKLYADFYSSDVIVASPLGLRTIIGAEGEQERDYDFLASIELLVLDQTEIFLMQNWDHVFHILNHMHLQPKESHGTDFSRVRTWSLNGWSKYYRQTLIFSSLVLPEINAVFNKKCQNYAGKVRIANHIEFGCINQVFIQLPHVFHRFEAQNITEVIDTRFEFFLNKILPIQKDSLMKQTLIFIPSYFDYVRIRNYFKKEDINFVQICEYSKENKVARARDMFYHGDAHFLLYTERFHFFNRKQIKGIRHLVFYQPPNFPHFYYELCNLMQEANMNKNIGNISNMTVTVIYSKYDIHQLSAIVNTERAAKMIQSERKVHMMVTGVD